MKILIAGDFVPQGRVIDKIEAKDFGFVLGKVQPLLEDADYSIVNLEAPVITNHESPIVKTGPHLYCRENALEALKQTGFRCVTLANNHFRDQGEQGVVCTLEACKQRGLDTVGGGLTLNEAQQILYKSIGSKTVAVINFCENEWSIASESYGGSAPLNPIQNFYQIKEAKEKADYVLVIVHGGIELYNLPTPRMQETYRFFIDAGADAMINHHQHWFVFTYHFALTSIVLVVMKYIRENQYSMVWGTFALTR